MRIKNNRNDLTTAVQQRNIFLLKYRFTPYFIIILFSIGVTFVRFYMIPEWGLLIHLGLFGSQILILTCIWHLIKRLNNFLDKRIPFNEGPFMRVTLQVVLTMLIILPFFAVAAYFVWPYTPPFVTRQFIALSIALFVIMIFLFNFAFFAFYFFNNWQQSIEDKAQLQIQAAELEREKFDLQYHQLRNQVNPHYLFNTLTSLDGLIQTNPELASEFVRHMSKVYRYVLQHKENEVVSLDEELEFIRHYIQLLHIRYDSGLKIHYDLSPEAKEKGIVMVTLQMLIDNAVKHNILLAAAPLHIDITDEPDYLVIYNNKQLRRQIETSNRQGLKQLKQLYSFLSDKPLIIEEDIEHYTIKIPLL